MPSLAATTPRHPTRPQRRRRVRHPVGPMKRRRMLMLMRQMKSARRQATPPPKRRATAATAQHGPRRRASCAAQRHTQRQTEAKTCESVRKCAKACESVRKQRARAEQAEQAATGRCGAGAGGRSAEQRGAVSRGRPLSSEPPRRRAPMHAPQHQRRSVWEVSQQPPQPLPQGRGGRWVGGGGAEQKAIDAAAGGRRRQQAGRGQRHRDSATVRRDVGVASLLVCHGRPHHVRAELELQLHIQGVGREPAVAQRIVHGGDGVALHGVGVGGPAVVRRDDGRRARSGGPRVDVAEGGRGGKGGR